MKKVLLVLAIAAGVSVNTYAQKATAKKAVKKEIAKKEAAAPAVEGPSFAWTETTKDFGKIEQGKPQTHAFTFKNNGNAPLVLSNVQASCGCTTPEWTKEPIAPGASGVIKATYNAAAAGAFSKTITVTSNTPTATTVLTIKGEVLTKPAAAAGTEAAH
jgi:hypothetical protein